MGVSVRFEKENIDTKTLTTELMVSVSGSLAQQESISISANQKMSYQRRMERGEFITCTAGPSSTIRLPAITAIRCARYSTTPKLCVMRR